MQPFIFVTSNKEKIETALRHLGASGITFETKNFEMHEIQSESTEEVAVEKAKLAYNEFRQPVVISDHGWAIPALNGFPGPFMRYVKKWFKVTDFLNLISPYSDKTIIKKEVICYCDENGPKIFVCEMSGKLIDLGKVDLTAVKDLMEIVSLKEGGLSVADCNSRGVDQSDKYDLWEKFAEFYKTI